MRDIAIFAGGVFAVLLVAITTVVIVTTIICSKTRKLRKGTVIQYKIITLSRPNRCSLAIMMHGL